jgi:hypothetical protein
MFQTSKKKGTVSNTKTERELQQGTSILIKMFGKNKLFQRTNSVL